MPPDTAGAMRLLLLAAVAETRGCPDSYVIARLEAAGYTRAQIESAVRQLIHVAANIARETAQRQERAS
jgi:hypothetical protein